MNCILNVLFRNVSFLDKVLHNGEAVEVECFQAIVFK